MKLNLSSLCESLPTTSTDIEVDIASLRVRWHVDTRHKPNRNKAWMDGLVWHRRISSPEFTFQDGRHWRLSYCYSFVDGPCLFLEKVSPGAHAPFDVFTQVTGSERIVTEQHPPQEARYEADNNCRSIWMRKDPEFGQNDDELRFLVELKKDDVEEINSVATQTKCSLPERFELPCMVSLTEDFAWPLVQGSDPDVEFQCAGRSINAHGAVVSARSPVIACMLASDMVEGRTRIINIRDMTLVVFQHFLRYLYTARLPELTFEVALDLYEHADQYAVLGLARRCSRYLVEHLSDQNACDLLVVADAHSDEGFAEEVVDYMVERKIPRTSDLWSSFCEEHPRLANKVLNCLCKLIPV